MLSERIILSIKSRSVGTERYKVRVKVHETNARENKFLVSTSNTGQHQAIVNTLQLTKIRSRSMTWYKTAQTVGTAQEIYASDLHKPSNSPKISN